MLALSCSCFAAQRTHSPKLLTTEIVSSRYFARAPRATLTFQVRVLPRSEHPHVCPPPTITTHNHTVHPAWAPLGARRFLRLVHAGFFNNIPLFRVVPGFLVQFGISLDPDMNSRFAEQLKDDPPLGISFRKGLMAFAGYGVNSRSTQVFIGYEGAAGLGNAPWETPFAEVLLILLCGTVWCYSTVIMGVC